MAVLERWIHTADGTLKPDNPYETVGAKFIFIKADQDRHWRSDHWIDTEGVIDEICVGRNKRRREKTISGRSNTVWVRFGVAPHINGYGAGRAIGLKRVLKSSLKLIP